MTTTFVTIGSCLTTLPGVFLMNEYKWSRLNTAKVDRSDLFLRDFVLCAGMMPPREEILAFASPRPEHRAAFDASLDGHYRETIGLSSGGKDCLPLAQTLETGGADVILMDNMFDTYTHLLALDTPAGRRFHSTITFQLCENESVILARNALTTAPLTGAQSAANWIAIAQFFRSAAPGADIFFACSPECLSPHDPARSQRSRDFQRLFRPQADALGVRLIPPLGVERQHTKLPDDDSHFESIVYKAMAGHIALAHLSGGTARSQAGARRDAA